jgi:hypothetical protein
LSVEKEGLSKPLRLTKVYYRCLASTADIFRLLRQDEALAVEISARHRQQRASVRRYQSIHRVWPDFPVRALMDQSVPTIKADAALRAFAADGKGIVWAVLDSGIDAAHPHFGDASNPDMHTLLNETVATLHRCFAPVPNSVGVLAARGEKGFDG